MLEGHSPKVVQQFVGYTTRRWAVVLYPMLTIITGGLLWVVGQRYLQARLWTLQRCSLSKAQYVHAKISPGSTAHALHLISLLLVVYIYDAAEDSFKVVPDMPVDTSTRIHNAQNALQHIELGAEWSCLCPMSSRHRHETMCLYGMNDMSVVRPSMLQLAGAVLAYPPFIVQYFELACMFYAKFYMVASCLLFMTLASSFVSTYKLYKKRLELFHAVGQQRLITIVLAGRVRATSSKKLVPGDVIVVLPETATCDLVLLQGTCLVEESNLSGEPTSAQVRKSSFVSHDEAHGRAYHPETHHWHTIHAGASVQPWDAYMLCTSTRRCTAVFALSYANSLRTTMGNMLHQIVAPLHKLSLAKDPFLSDLSSFCGFALILQLCIFLIAAVPHFRTHQQPVSEYVAMVLGTVMTALPVAVPTVILGANAACTAQLKQRGIDVLMVAKLKTIAAVEVVCFDKTGTLTGSVAELHGLVPVEQGSFTGLQSMAMRWPNRLKQALAVCNSLTLIGKNQLVGDDADKQAFKAVEARFLVTLRLPAPFRPVRGPGSVRMAKSTTVALSQDELKKQAAHKAVEYAKSGMVLGLGTGSTTAFAIDRIGELMKNGELKDIIGVPTSIKSYEQASALGIPLATLDEQPEIDLAIDGADEVDPKLNVVKGRGGALLREKLVEQASKKFVCIVDESKLVEGLGGSKDAMPVEIVQFCYKYNLGRLQDLPELAGSEAKLRMNGDKPYITDNQNYIVDLYFQEPLKDPYAAAEAISKLTGIVDHGLFLNMVDVVVIAGKDGVRLQEK